MLSSVRHAAPFLLVLTHLFFLLPRGAAAQVSIKAEVGFGGLFQLGQPFPLSVTVANHGRPVEGMLRAQVWKGGPTRGGALHPLLYEKRLFVSARSERRVQLVIEPDLIGRPVVVTFAGPRVSASAEINLRGHFSSGPLIILVSPGGVPPSLRSPVPSSPLVVSDLSGLPSDPRGYRGVWAVFFYEQPLRDLSKAQAKALESWLMWGGRLVVFGGLNYAILQEQAWKAFLPARVRGLGSLSSAPSLERAYGARFQDRRPILFHEVEATGGKVILEENGHPLAIERSKGHGRLFFVAFDVGRPPLADWPGLQALIKDLLGTPAEHRVPWVGSWDDRAFSHLLASPGFLGAQAPSLALLLWILAYAAGLYVSAKVAARGRRIVGGVGLASAYVLVFAVFGFFYFDRRGGVPDGVLVSSTLAESSPEGVADMQSNLALFSTRNREYRVRLQGGWKELDIVPSRDIKGEQDGLTMELNGAESALRLKVGAWSYRLLRGRWIEPAPALAEVEPRGEASIVRLTNVSSQDLVDCWLLAGGQRFFLGDLSPGGSREQLLPAGATRARQPGGDLSQLRFSDPARQAVFRQLLGNDPLSAAGGMMVLGWLRGEPPRARVEDASVRSFSHTLVRFVFPSVSEEEDA